MASSANTAKKRLTKSTPTPTKQKEKQGKAKPRSMQKVTVSDAEGDSTSAGSSESSSVSESTSDSEEEDEDEDEDEEGEEEEEEEEETPVIPPPTDFLRLPSPPSSSGNPFSPKNLAGKELWLISAPSSAPLSKLRSVNAADVLDNAQVLGTSSGRRFSVRETDEGAGVQVLVPDGRGGYLLGGRSITKSVQFFETLPDRKALEKRRERVVAKSVRAQPDGLKMRFKPMGYVGDQDEDGMPDAVEPEISEPVRKKKRREGGEEEGERKHKSKNKKEILS
ncbi:DNA-directed RNA polymerase I subunit RPA34.5-domain-containing protein [Tuber borchii]|uniref:DNA-directed RNA polymerase I subunit RPA34.5-domain-containing protein n=1 Tax=Tuber borchii TaxID=42251 RepID=A0A2T7A728_TUBBO|nr:DNA-directed RNA polymerase I subunit RPA34.5-domain-containing protein [Tuber borchii]